MCVWRQEAGASRGCVHCARTTYIFFVPPFIGYTKGRFEAIKDIYSPYQIHLHQVRFPQLIASYKFFLASPQRGLTGGNDMAVAFPFAQLVISQPVWALPHSKAHPL